MAIDNIRAYSHLTDEDIAAIGARFDAIKQEVESDLGERDARYITNLIRVQRGCEIAGRAALFFGKNKTAFATGTGLLALSKILENLEIGHNVMHGQWDWMNDPTVHSTTWEWDNNCPSEQWMHSHNYIHHTFTNVLGMDNDVGYGVLRVTRDRKWQPYHLAQPLTNTILATFFQWAVAFYDVELGKIPAGKATWEETKPKLWQTIAKVRNQMAKDYAIFPLVALPFGLGGTMLKGNMLANLIRNLWAYSVIFCGHFPDETETFTKKQHATEDHNQWYLRQMLGSANFRGGFLLSVLSGNLNYQIEHHLFPTMPSNRLAEVGKKVEKVARDYDLPYHTGSFPEQFFKVQKTLLKLSLPPRFMVADKDNAPEVRSNAAFSDKFPVEQYLHVGEGENGVRRGLATGLNMLKKIRPGVKEVIMNFSGRTPLRR